MTKALSRRRPVFLERAQGGLAQPGGIALALLGDADDQARDEFGDLVGAIVQLQFAQRLVERGPMAARSSGPNATSPRKNCRIGIAALRTP
jgi:hypothetical protein